MSAFSFNWLCQLEQLINLRLIHVGHSINGGINFQGSLYGRCVKSLAGSRHLVSSPVCFSPLPGGSEAGGSTWAARAHDQFSPPCHMLSLRLLLHSLCLNHIPMSLFNIVLSTRLQTPSGQGPAYLVRWCVPISCRSAWFIELSKELLSEWPQIVKFSLPLSYS